MTINISFFFFPDGRKRKEGGRIEPLYYHGQLYLIIYPIKLKTLTYYPDPGRIAGIEPASSPWQGEILPFNYIRIFLSPMYSIHQCRASLLY